MPSNAESKTLALQHMPPGAVRWMGLDGTATTVGKMWSAIAQAVKLYGYDVIETLRRELKARQMVERIPDWERILRIPTDTTRSYDQRRAEIISRRREFGASSLPDVLGALHALCGPTAVTMLEHTRAAVRSVNTHSFGPITATAGNTGFATLTIGDNAGASLAGVQLKLNISTGDAGQFLVMLTAPDAQELAIPSTIGSRTVPAPTPNGADRIFFWPEFAGGQVDGTWTITVDNTGGGVTDVQVDTADLFVGGIGRATSGAPGLEGIIFEWSAVIDEAAVGDGYDRAVAIRLASRWNPAHCDGGVALYQSDAGLTALGDDSNCIGDLCIGD